MTGLLIVAAVMAVLLMMAALSSAAETGLSRLSRSRAENLEQAGLRPTKTLVDLLEDREAASSPLWLLRVCCQGAPAVLLTVIVVDRAAIWWLLVWGPLGLAVVYVLTETIPRTWALRQSDRSALLAVRMVGLAAWLRPLLWGLSALHGLVDRLRFNPAGTPTVSEHDLIDLTEAAVQADAIEASERDLIESALLLGDTMVREVMVPRTDMVTATAATSITAAIEIAIEKGLSRLPMSGCDIDDILGIVVLKDLALAERSGRGGLSARTVMRQVKFVPETKRAHELLAEMRTARGPLAVVVDEYGGTAGLVTLEDLVEVLVGEIVDEFDPEESLLEPLAGGEVLVHGRMPVDQLNGMMDADLPDDDWDTVGGLIFNTLGHVPDVGEAIDVDGLKLRVEHMVGRRITQVRLTRIEPGGPDAAADRVPA